MIIKNEKPCGEYLRGSRCKDPQGRDHCFNCARHLDPSTLACPKSCELLCLTCDKPSSNCGCTKRAGKTPSDAMMAAQRYANLRDVPVFITDAF